MNFLQKLLGKKQAARSGNESARPPQQLSTKEKNIPIPDYLPVSAAEKELVSIIATSIAAGDRPNSRFTIKSIRRVNDEKAVVAAIATAIAAGDHPQSEFVIKKLVRTK